MPNGDEPEFLEGFAGTRAGGSSSSGHFDLVFRGICRVFAQTLAESQTPPPAVRPDHSMFRERLYHLFRNISGGTKLPNVSEIGGCDRLCPQGCGRKLLCRSTRMKGGKEP